MRFEVREVSLETASGSKDMLRLGDLAHIGDSKCQQRLHSPPISIGISFHSISKPVDLL